MTPALTICLHAFPGQHATNKQHYVKTKQYTLACPSNDHAAIYSQVKRATIIKGYFFPTKNRQGCSFHTHLMLPFHCAHKQMTDPLSSVMGKQYFALHLTGQSIELNTLPRLSGRLVWFLLFNFFAVSSLHPFLLSVMSSMSTLALCWKITSFQSHSE